MSLGSSKNAARKYGISPEQEAFARFLAELISGSPYTPDELGTFEASSVSQEWARPVTNARAVLLAPADTRRKQLVVNLTNSGSPIVIGGSDQVTFAQGTPIAAGAERALGDFSGEVWAIANVAGPLDVRVRVER